MNEASTQFPCYLFSFTVDGYLTDINDILLRSLGYERDELIPDFRFEDILTKGSRIFFKTHFLPMLMMQHKVNEMFLSFNTKQEQDFPVLINLTLEEKEGKRVIHAAGIQIEKRNKFEKSIIEAKEAAETALKENVLLLDMKSKLERNQDLLERQLHDLKRINREHVEFNKILSHDLQEPMRKVRLFAGLLEGKIDKKELNPELQTYLVKLLRLSEYAHELIARLQSFHSLEDRMNDAAEGDLEEIIGAAHSRIGNDEIKVNLEGIKESRVFGDITLLTRVFRELLANAWQFRDPDRPVEVEIKSEIVTDNYYKSLTGAYRYIDFLQIQFKDNASGFPPNVNDRIFGLLQKFHENSGRGLGLAYCKKIVELHNGRILANTRLKQGTQFTIILPNSLDVKYY
ncbi:sensor histidine kinase [Zeaxanthinibacter enoshimensis]|uniref:histidine kinase n=1 Tax=Zeaxanthinibacter enoshimensis TaxID=392009 RepID=A0A4R6TJZ7_9FLAO|nr:ATP-binding protein [Zeaxanthinibacter enoshimensis]TDQ31186.1 sigma-B regulation protein RsbU (phosphoserine phosphatase) [Zeaxanthinibacter enoshimensis]